MVAAKDGQADPPGLGTGCEGRPTTDAQGRARRLDAADRRRLSPKGGMLALVVELLVTALIGASFGFEA